MKKKVYAHLEKGDRLYINAYERMSKKFDKTVEGWSRQEQILASKIGRHADNSIYKKSDQARTIKETKDLLEAITSDHDKYGNMAW